MLLVAGLVLFLGVHLLPTFPKTRAGLLERLGAPGYRAVFTIVSVAGFVFIVYGFGQARTAAWNVQLWVPPVWTKHIAFLLMWPAFLLLAAAFAPSHIRDRARHPMLASIKIWALAHLLANGDLAGIILFASFLAYGVYDRISVKKRQASGPPGERHAGFVNDAIVVAAGTAVYLFMLFYGHSWLIGVRLLG